MAKVQLAGAGTEVLVPGTLVNLSNGWTGGREAGRKPEGNEHEHGGHQTARGGHITGSNPCKFFPNILPHSSLPIAEKNLISDVN